MRAVLNSPRKDEYKEVKRDSIFENKALYLRNKKQQEIQQLEIELKKEKIKIQAYEDQTFVDSEKLKIKH